MRTPWPCLLLYLLMVACSVTSLDKVSSSDLGSQPQAPFAFDMGKPIGDLRSVARDTGPGVSEADLIAPGTPVSSSDSSDSAPSFGQIALPFRVIDAEFSRPLGRVVLLGEVPNRVYLIDVDSGDQQTIDLPLVGTAIAVSPDGRTAVVGHDGYISHLDLAKATLLSTPAVACPVGDLVLGGNGFAYAFASSDSGAAGIHTVRLSDGMELSTDDWTTPVRTRARLHPQGGWIYGADRGVPTDDIEKYDVSGGVAQYKYNSPYDGDYAVCGNLWFTEDGKRIISACGRVFRTSALQTMDMIYAGSMLKDVRFLWAEHNAKVGYVAAIRSDNESEGPSDADQSVALYEDNFLQLQKELPLPALLEAGVLHALHGRFVFFRADGQSVVVVADVDSVGKMPSALIRLGI